MYADKFQTKNPRLLVLAISLAIALLYSILVAGWKQGLGVVVFAAISTLLTLILFAAGNLLRQKAAFCLLIPIVVLSLDLLIFNHQLVVNFGPLLLLVLIFTFFALLTFQNPEKHSFLFREVPLLKNVFSVFKKIRLVLQDISFRKEPLNAEVCKKIFFGFFVSLPLLLVFFLLFVNADKIFKDLIFEIFDTWLAWWMLRTFLIFIFAAGFLYLLISGDNILGQRNILVEKFDAVVVGTILTLLNALFAIFVFVQIKYLFGNYDYVLKNGLVFSEYAKRGFYELITASILAGLIILVVHRSFAHHGAPKALSAAQSIFIIQTTVLAASALKRMNIYQEAYGYTVSRLYAEWMIYFIIAFLIVALLNFVLSWKFKTFLYVSFGLGLVTVISVFSVNIDATIAAKNLERAIIRGKKLDLDYLRGLSADVLPPMAKYLNSQEASEKLSAEEIRDFYRWLLFKKADGDSKFILEYKLSDEKIKTAVNSLLASYHKIYQRSLEFLKQKDYLLLKKRAPHECTDYPNLKIFTGWGCATIAIEQKRFLIINRPYYTASNKTEADLIIYEPINSVWAEERGRLHLKEVFNPQKHLLNDGTIAEIDDHAMQIKFYRIKFNGISLELERIR